MIWISIVLALAIPGFFAFAYLTRRGDPGDRVQGFGWQFIRYTVIVTGIPIAAILALNDALSGEVAAIIAGAMGYAFGKSSER